MISDSILLVGIGNFNAVTEPVDATLRNTLYATRKRDVRVGVEEASVGWQLADECWRNLDVYVDGGQSAISAVVERVAREVVSAVQFNGINGPFRRHNVLNGILASQPVEAC